MNPHINMAADIADLASDLDHYKNKLPQPLKQRLADCSSMLHDLAETLLGADVGQVYAQDDQPNNERVAAAGMVA
jgi:hypothetical protein